MCLAHSDTCPNRLYRQFVEIENRPLVFSSKFFRLAVCLALIDGDKKVLVTRRNIKMKIFPRAWVLPGGHVEPKESLEDAVIRELMEETGVEILSGPDSSYTYKGQKCKLSPYYAFESVSVRIYDGSEPPNSCHLILFFAIELSQKSSDIELKLCPREVDAAVWLSFSQLEVILSNKNHIDGFIEGLEVNEDASMKKSKFELELFRPPYPNKLLGGISKAHNCALRFLIQSKKPSL